MKFYFSLSKLCKSGDARGSAWENMLTKGNIIQNQRLLSDAEIFDIRILAPEIARTASPGQIVHVRCGEAQTLRRPISICDTEGDIIRLCYEVRGKGTAYMASLTPGMTADVLGPSGNGFRIADSSRILLVGGGIGIYPLLSAAKAVQRSGGHAKALLGFRTAALVHLTEDFLKNGISVEVSTDDGSYGKAGRVTELLKSELENSTWDAVLVCGPRPMMAAAAALAGLFKTPCQVSMEERMGCGVGACLSCVCKTLFYENQEVTERYKRVCVDGPVFDAKEIIWS